MSKRIYWFSKTKVEYLPNLNEYIGQAKNILGGKGSSLVDMCHLGMNVPPGFTITTNQCNIYRGFEGNTGARADWIKDLMLEVKDYTARLDQYFGYTPLMSVRSGAPVSMPGMMDTILNVGLTTKTVDDWGKRIGERGAFDSYRRLMQMMGETAFGVPKEVFDAEMLGLKNQEGVTEDTELDIAALKALCVMYDMKFKAAKQKEFPNTLEEQLEAAILAVFDSWMNPRAIEYRKMNNISEDIGTAVTVQAMVFGNMGEDCGSGVLFTRNPSTGEKYIMGEYLANAQGEDVVAGIRTPEDLAVETASSDAATNIWKLELLSVCQNLEEYYKDMVDVEFTVQKGELFILQSRVGKRSARAAFKIAVDLVDEKVIDEDTALSRLTTEQFKVVRRPNIDPLFAYKEPPNYKGLPACPGVAVGVPVFTSEDAVSSKVPCILVTHETTPDDIAGMNAARGIFTKTGGATSHAAVVARAMDKPCIVGCTDLDIEALKTGSTSITIDGATGNVWINKDVPVIDSSNDPEIKRVMQWCLNRMGAVQQTVVDLDDGTPHRIMAAHWWGDEEVLDTVLSGLSEMENLEGVHLDIRSPFKLKSQDDHDLEMAFGVNLVVTGPGFSDKIYDMLMNDDFKLKGLIVSPVASAIKIDNLRERGIIVPTEPHTMSDIMSNYIMSPSASFIDNVIGGASTWFVVKEILKKSGFEMKMAPEGVPLEYATFHVLAKKS